jgi:hypothetical protein
MQYTGYGDPPCEKDGFGLPSGTSFRQRRSLVVRHSIQVKICVMISELLSLPQRAGK